MKSGQFTGAVLLFVDGRPSQEQAASQVGSADENDIAGYMSAAAQDWMIQPSSRRDGTVGVTVEASH